MECTTDEVKECPCCHSGLEELDSYLETADGIWYWNCFNCGHNWCAIEPSEPTEVDEEEET